MKWRAVLRSVIAAAMVAAAVHAFVLGALASSLPRVVGRADVEASRVIRLPSARQVVLQNESGSVQVRVHELNETRVEAVLRAYTASREDTERLRAVLEEAVQVQSDGDTVTVTTAQDGLPATLEVVADYRILAPEGTDISIRGTNGNIWLSRGCGSISVQGDNTDIEIDRPLGPVVATSTNGRVRVTDAPAGATIRTVNGNVYAHMLGGPLDASTVNGSIVARMVDSSVTACRLTSQNGGITLMMRDGCSARVAAATKRGRVTSDFPVEGAEPREGPRQLRGQIGDGYTDVALNTLNGNIWIAKGSR